MTPTDQVGFWPARAGEWMGLFADLSAVLIALTLASLWLRGRNPLISLLLTRSRSRTVGAVVARGSRSRTVAVESRRMTARVLDGTTALTVAEEIAWLDGLTVRVGRTAPVAFRGLGGPEHQDLQQLAVAYRSFARGLQSRGLFGGGTAPVVATVAAVAEQTAELMAIHAAFARGAPIEAPPVSFTAARGGSSFTLEPGADDIGVSHVRDRVVIDGTPMAEACSADGVRPLVLGLGRDERAALDRRMDGRFFDGALPSLRQSCRQRDPTSGWTRLHLVLAETAYSAVVATQYVGDQGVGRAAGELRAEAALLTLSCLPVTVDGCILAARRSAQVRTDEGRWGPAVNGNLEMRPRFGIAIDTDKYGVPDPRRAIVREAQEELGLRIGTDNLEVIGLVRFESAEQVNTSVLLTSCQVDATAEDVVRQSRFAHATEGRWELEGQILAIPRPDGDAVVDDLLSWTLTATDHQPHLTAALVAYCLPGLLDRMAHAGAVTEHLQSLAAGAGPALPVGAHILSR